MDWVGKDYTSFSDEQDSDDSWRCGLCKRFPFPQAGLVFNLRQRLSFVGTRGLCSARLTSAEVAKELVVPCCATSEMTGSRGVQNANNIVAKSRVKRNRYYHQSIFLVIH